mmetsp:Transcript_8366/g.35026  ORF Transcript_8366/g.35026 Transcript_8366/m.35026 type:complete len:160 (-) Transcript_8366:66-545(-)
MQPDVDSLALSAKSDLAQLGHFFASSELDPSHRAERARFGCTFREGGEAWSAASNDTNQWLAVALPDRCVVTSIVTAGCREKERQYVTSYNLEHTLDNASWTTLPTTFGGNWVLCSHRLPQPIIARAIRIRPVTWSGHITVKLAVYGSFIEQSSNELST